MDIGIGLPSTVPGAPGSEITGWARAAEAAGFSTLGTLDRVVFDNYDPIPVLAAAAAVTDRIGLMTSILIAPYRGNGALLAKQLASVDRLSNGRLTVGIAVGTRRDDNDVTGSLYDGRGRAMDDLLSRMQPIWADDRSDSAAIGPEPVRRGGPPLLIGGTGSARCATSPNSAPDGSPAAVTRPPSQRWPSRREPRGPTPTAPVRCARRRWNTSRSVPTPRRTPRGTWATTTDSRTRTPSTPSPRR